MAECLSALFLNHRMVGDWLAATELGVEAARETGHPVAEARLLCLLSRPLADNGQLAEARSAVERAMELADASAQPVHMASAREFAGRLWEADDPERALRLFRRSEELNHEAEEPRGAALVRYYAGAVERKLGRHEQARARLTVALEDFLRLLPKPDLRMAGRVRIALAELDKDLGRLAAAQEQLDRAAENLQEEGAAHYEEQARHLLLAWAEEAGDLDGKRRQLKRILDLRETGRGPDADALRSRLDDLGGPL
jgi:tetratricopeptide (TPR) repeat protein